MKLFMSAFYPFVQVCGWVVGSAQDSSGHSPPPGSGFLSFSFCSFRFSYFLPCHMLVLGLPGCVCWMVCELIVPLALPPSLNHLGGWVGWR
ncbi:hypothetical protein I7I48_10673 [Histoplasma ohiense]|nr:hypothetical protein I7I48_10673 [Histoplasma ohiense (nom. inval.)]